MPSLRLTTKHALTVVAISLLLLLAALIFATQAQGAAGFLTTPIGTVPVQVPVNVVESYDMPVRLLRLTHVEPIKYVPPPPQRPRPVYVAPTRLPSAKPSGGCYTEPGTPPAYIMAKESGNPTEWNREGSSASGCWQIIGSTWCGRSYPNCTYKGYPNAASAPPSVQNQRAKELWAGGAGCSHWEQTADEC